MATDTDSRHHQPISPPQTPANDPQDQAIGVMGIAPTVDLEQGQYADEQADSGVPSTSNTLVKQWSSQEAFLLAFRGTGTVLQAAAGICDRTMVYYWRKNDCQGFNARFEKAQHSFREYLEQLALHRIKDPTGNRGSDVLLLALLNANYPEKYRPNVVVDADAAKAVLAALRKPQVVVKETEEIRDS